MKAVFPSALFLCLSVTAYAETTSLTPYIDRLKKTMPEKPALTSPTGSQTPFIDSIRSTLKPAPYAVPGSYIEKLKKSDEAARGPQKEEGSYTEQQKLKLEKKEPQSAIADLKAGKSQLKAKMTGDIHHAAGLRMGAAMSRSVTGEYLARSYSQVYGDAWVPDLAFHYEYQPFHSEWFGNFGLCAELGITRAEGKGTFKGFESGLVSGGKTFDAPRTKFQFYTFPFNLGLNYRFNLFRLFRPFAMVGPTLIGYWEGRDDSKSGYRGYSKGLLFSGGVSVLLDWLSPSGAWNLYVEQGMRHSYLTVEYVRLTSLQSEVDLSNSGISVGLLFEY